MISRVVFTFIFLVAGAVWPALGKDVLGTDALGAYVPPGPIGGVSAPKVDTFLPTEVVARELNPQHIATVRDGLVVGGAMIVNQIVSPTGSLTLRGSVASDCILDAVELRTHRLSTKALSAVLLTNPSGEVKVAGRIKVTGSVSFDKNAPVFSTNLFIDGIPQWRLVSHEDFEDMDDILGWSALQLDTSDIGGTQFLRGKDTHLSKIMSGLGPHKQLRVQAKYHFIDGWEDETAFLKIDDRVVWMDTHKGGLKLNSPIDVTIPHDKESVNLSFGAHPSGKRFGVDDVMLFVR